MVDKELTFKSHSGKPYLSSLPGDLRTTNMDLLNSRVDEINNRIKTLNENINEAERYKILGAKFLQEHFNNLVDNEFNNLIGSIYHDFNTHFRVSDIVATIRKTSREWVNQGYKKEYDDIAKSIENIQPSLLKLNSSVKHTFNESYIDDSIKENKDIYRDIGINENVDLLFNYTSDLEKKLNNINAPYFNEDLNNFKNNLNKFNERLEFCKGYYKNNYLNILSQIDTMNKHITDYTNELERTNNQINKIRQNGE